MRRGDPVGEDDGRVIVAFWSALDLLRPLVLLYVVYQYVQRLPEVQHPERGWVVLGVLGLWTVLTLIVRRRTRTWLAVELFIGAAAVIASALVDSPQAIADGAPTVPGMWPAATVLSWAVLTGPLGGTAAAAVIAIADIVLIGTPSDLTMHNIVILLLLGALVGYCAELARDGQRASREAAAIKAASMERERLARSVHDGVLQALSYVHRRGLEIGGDAAELGRLAAEQERSLRDLIRTPIAGPALRRGVGGATATASPTGSRIDLPSLLAERAGEAVSVVDTGEPLLMSGSRAREVDAAVGAALDNVARHAGEGARAWILVEKIEEDVMVTVRDNGRGMAPGRLEEAREEGRLGVCSSILGRMEDLGGSAEITTSASGTRVELRAPIRGRDYEGDA